ncbi:MAG: peptidoglycan DD-metalloendopeptidase family protein [Methylobacteriaceae bacterium]|nr:peptidoglycan DD-metalloendopeptidase family protein [Methylobacteriaceae bacterium]
MRLDAFSNPFSSSTQASDTTGSIDPNVGVASKLRAAQGVAKTAQSAPATSAAAIAAAAPVTGSAAGWSAAGGTPITLAKGETLSTISSRYGVPESALLQANGFGSAAEATAGSRVIVPVYNAGAGRAAAAVARAPLPAPQQAATRLETAKAKVAESPKAAARPVVAAAKTVEKPATKPVAKIETVAPKAAVKPIKLAEKPAAKIAEVKPKAEPVKVAKVAPKPAETTTVAKTAPVEPKPVRQPEAPRAAKVDKPVAAEPKQADPTTTASLPPGQPEKPVADAAGNPEFRWPARGRIIQGFRANGNDGINISVPEGTSVKAAEGGVVAYAGNELKGYGNLVLIRHPNGFVSAYAHNGEIAVKRGEQVKRGQTIAKSGQSGNVSSPQLHFELRKGSTPVDPTQYLAGL